MKISSCYVDGSGNRRAIYLNGSESRILLRIGCAKDSRITEDNIRHCIERKLKAIYTFENVNVAPFQKLRAIEISKAYMIKNLEKALFSVLSVDSLSEIPDGCKDELDLTNSNIPGSVENFDGKSSFDHLCCKLFRSELHYLTVERTSINCIPSSISFFNNLTSLDLSRNQLHSIGPPLLNLPLLRYLDISYNKLKSLDYLQSLTSLEMLHASNNQLATLHKTIGMLIPLAQTLRILDLSFNVVCCHLSYADEILSLFPHLIAFDRISLSSIHSSYSETTSKNKGQHYKKIINSNDFSNQEKYYQCNHISRLKSTPYDGMEVSPRKPLPQLIKSWEERHSLHAEDGLFIDEIPLSPIHPDAHRVDLAAFDDSYHVDVDVDVDGMAHDKQDIAYDKPNDKSMIFTDTLRCRDTTHGREPHQELEGVEGLYMHDSNDNVDDASELGNCGLTQQEFRVRLRKALERISRLHGKGKKPFKVDKDAEYSGKKNLSTKRDVVSNGGNHMCPDEYEENTVCERNIAAAFGSRAHVRREYQHLKDRRGDTERARVDPPTYSITPSSGVSSKGDRKTSSGSSLRNKQSTCAISGSRASRAISSKEKFDRKSCGSCLRLAQEENVDSDAARYTRGKGRLSYGVNDEDATTPASEESKHCDPRSMLCRTAVVSDVVEGSRDGGEYEGGHGGDDKIEGLPLSNEYAEVRIGARRTTPISIGEKREASTDGSTDYDSSGLQAPRHREVTLVDSWVQTTSETGEHVQRDAIAYELKPNDRSIGRPASQ